MRNGVGFHLISSNRLDVLAGDLAARLARPVAEDTLLSPYTILIPQPTLRRWLQSWLARHLGIAANLRFLTPSEFTWELLRADRPDLPAISPWDGARLRWRLFALLTDDPPAEVAEHLGRAAGAPELAVWRLAASLAVAFDRYQAYRRSWLEAWEVGAAAQDWQANLWRRLQQDDDAGPSRSRLLGDWLRRYDRARAVPPGLPAQLAAFGTVHVSPDVLRLLAVCAQHATLDFYRPTPCAEYWGDIEAMRSLLRRDGVAALPAALASAQHDNPLLQAWGAAGRDFDAQLFAYDLALPASETECYVEPPRTRVLHALQADIFERAAPQPLARVHAHDQSIQIHACHSRLREVEVLHDRLRAMLDPQTQEGAQFEPPLQPHEIAVLAPNIADYLPLAGAVFGGVATDDPVHIPYTLSDRPQLQAHPMVGLFLSLLDLRDARRTLSEVRDLLAVPQVMAALDLSESDLERIEDWCVAAGIAWGEDEAQRAALGLGRWREHSFAFGLDRLLLGYATGEGSDAIASVTTPAGPAIAPCAVVEGGDAERLDALVSLLARLRHLAQWQRSAHSAAAWQERLATDFNALLPTTTQDAAEQQARRIVLDALDAFAEQAAEAGPLPLDVVRAALAEALQLPSAQQPFLGGGVTFAGMVPLRTVPFRVICLLGMDADAFPRHEAHGDINRMTDALARGIRGIGDRSVREDDRYLLLQLLTAARDVFYLSYGGRDARDGSVREPSALVSELLDVAQRYFPQGESASARLRIEHPLQPFSAQAFGAGDARRFSYRQQWRQETAQIGLQPPPAFFDAPLPALHSVDQPSLDELRFFLRNPARAWLQGRLGVQLPPADQAARDDEPLGEHRLQQHRRVALLLQNDLDEAGLRARALLPPGNGAHAAYIEAERIAAPVAAAASAWLAETGATVQRLSARLSVCGHDLPVQLTDVYGDRRALRLAGRYRGKYWLDALIEHLAFAALRGGAAQTAIFYLNPEKTKSAHGKPRKSDIAGQTQLPSLTAEHATAWLETLFALRQTGMQRPLPFAPNAAAVYLKALQNKDPETAYAAAVGEFNGNYGEAHDPWITLAFRPRGLLTDFADSNSAEFRDLARLVFYGPAELSA